MQQRTQLAVKAADNSALQMILPCTWAPCHWWPTLPSNLQPGSISHNHNRPRHYNSITIRAAAATAAAAAAGIQGIPHCLTAMPYR